MFAVGNVNLARLSINHIGDYVSKSKVSSAPDEASPLSHDSLVPSSSPRLYRSCSSPRVPVRLVTPGDGRTLQAFKAECDINRIMKRYQQTGVIDHVNRAQPRFGDVELYSFQDALNIVIEAEARFAALPAEVRDRFGNDPGRLLDFVSKPENVQEAVKLGLLDSPPAPVPPMPARPESPPAGSVASPGAIAPGAPPPPAS